MDQWLVAAALFLALAFLAAVSSIAMYNYRDNRWLAPLFFNLSVAFALISVPVFFVTGFAGGK